MASKLGPKEAAGLYLLVFVACLFFFVTGVLVGRWIPREPAQMEFVENTPEEETEQDLDLFREIVGGTPEDEADSPSQEPEEEQGVGEDAGSPIESTPEQTPVDASQGPLSTFYTVQVGAMENQRTVNQMVMRLTAKGYPSEVIPPGEQGNQAYLIWVDDCETRAEAEELELRLKEDGFPTYIKRIQRPRQP